MCHTNENETAIIAEELYNYYRGHSNLKIEVWVESLLFELSKNMKADKEHLSALLESIIEHDKKIPLENLPEYHKKQMFREISEWLVAEGLLKMVNDYKRKIIEGKKNRKLLKIKEILDISVVKELEDLPRFNDMDDLRSYLTENYLIDTSKLIGSGKRMVVYDFIPVEYPLPFPKEDSLTKAIVFRYPNKFLVIRIMNNIYREFLSDKLEESEHDSIKDFNMMDTFFTYSKKPPDGSNEIADNHKMAQTVYDSGHILKTHLIGESDQNKKFSFIPPLIIIKVKLPESNTEEFVTIQQKIKKRGEISLFDTNFKNDIIGSKSFRNKMKSFISALKGLMKAKGMMPDLIGSGNVLYNDKMNIYIVDINNVSKVPDFRTLCNMLLLRDIKIKIMEELNISILESITIENLIKISDSRKVLQALFDDYQSVCGDISNALKPEYNYHDMNELIDYTNVHDKKLLSFLFKIRFIDDLNEPIYLHNLDKVLKIEKFIHDVENNNKPYNFELEDFYKILYYKHGVWDKKNVFDLEDIIQNRKMGRSNWISFYTMGFYNSFVSARHTGGL